MRIVWSRELPAPPLGLSLAREPGIALTFDAERSLTRIDLRGQVELRRAAPATVTAAVITNEGRQVAALGRRGQVWLLSAQFDVIWQRELMRQPVSLAVDHLGMAVAVADDGGGLHVFDAHGQILWRATTPRPLVHLAFAPETGALVGAADLGLVCAFDRKGQQLWREGLMANVGSLAVCTKDGAEKVLLACFSEGLCCYPLARPRQERLNQLGACRRAVASYRGEVILTAGLDQRISLRDGTGAVRSELVLPGPPLELALSALGDRAVAVVDRAVIGLEM